MCVIVLWSILLNDSVCCIRSCIQHWTKVCVLWLWTKYDYGYRRVTVYNKAVVYSTDLQKLCCGCVPGMIMVSPVTMCNKAVFPQQYVSSVCIFASDVQFCVMHALCQSAVSVSILYRCCRVPPALRQYPVLESALCTKYYKWPFVKIFHNHAETICNPRVITRDKPL